MNFISHAWRTIQHTFSALPSVARIAVIVMPIVIVLAIVWMLWYVPPNTFVLKQDGWHPHMRTIEPGTAITFVNKSGRPFWPASNPHPQHGGYQGFDVGRPLASGESWTFTFEREGRWGFHDHLRSFYSGYINIGAAAAAYNCAEHLSGMSVGDKGLCWEQKLDEELYANGAKAAFELFAQYYASDPDFTQIGCHMIAHNIGDAAYGEYLRKGKGANVLQFPPETMYCGYGYYHGILEHLIRDNPDFKVADAFCKELIAEHEDEIPRIRLNCYHAIGHGFVPEPLDIEIWGNPSAMAAPAIAACYLVPEADARIECLQGTFNVIGDWMWNNQFGLKFPSEDSLALCRSFDDRNVAHACYYELSMRLAGFAEDDLSGIYARYVAQIPDDEIAGMVINSAAAGILGAHIAENDFIPYLMECRTLPDRVQVDCMKGLTGGFLAHGEPQKEYVKAIAFCSSPELTSSEKDVCYANIVRTFKGSYSQDKVTELCTNLEPAYRHYCFYE